MKRFMKFTLFVICMVIALLILPMSAGAVTLTSGTYWIQNLNSGLYLDVPGGSTASTYPLHQYTFNGTKAQKWTVTALGNGLYSLAPACNTNMRLDVYMANPANRQNVGIYPNTNQPTQKWKIVDNGNGAYKILTSLNGTSALQIPGGATNSGAPTQLWTYDKGRHHQWVFDKTTPQYNNTKLLTAFNFFSGRIRFKDNGTKYRLEFMMGAGSWNNVDMTFNEVTGNAERELEVSDYRQYGVNTIARTTWVLANPWTMRFNTPMMDKLNFNGRLNTAMHEQGHAIGIDHTRYGTVVYEYDSEITHLTQNDIENYWWSLFR